MVKRAISFLFITTFGCVIGTIAPRLWVHNGQAQTAVQNKKTAKPKQVLPPGIKVGEGVTFIPPSGARIAPRGARGENPDREFTLTMHSPERIEGKVRVVQGWGGIPVHFTLTHRGRRTMSRYQIAVMARTQGTKVHELAAEKVFQPYD